MKSIMQPRRAAARGVAWLLLPALIMVVGATWTGGARTALAQANGTVTVQKVLVDAAGQTVQGDLSGYNFTLTGAFGAAIQVGPTNNQGIAQISVAPGTYVAAEPSPRPGTTLVGFFNTGGQQVGNITVTSNQGTTVIARNQVAGTGSITVTKQLVDANNNPVAGDRSGFVFQVVGQITVNFQTSAFNATVTTDTNGTATLSNLAAGSYTVTEQPKTGSGFSFANATINGVPTTVNGQQFTLQQGSTNAIVVFNRAGGGTASVTVTKQIVDANGNVLTQDRSGFQFTLNCGGQVSAPATTDQNGNASFTGTVPAGTCVINETARTGFEVAGVFVGGSATNIGNGGSFTVTTGQTTNITVRNRPTAGAGTTVTITKQLVDASGNQVTGTRSGILFQVTCGTSFSQQATSDANGVATVNSVPAGQCNIQEAVPSGSTLGGIFVGTSTTDIGNGGAFTVTAGQPVSITVRNRTGGSTGPTEQVQLFNGCNNVSLTWTNGTPTATVAAAVGPGSILIAIWRFDNAAQRFVGFSPIPGAPNDLNTVNRFDPVFVCVNAGGSLARPTG